MDSCLKGEPEALGIFKTIYLFLQHHKFPKTAQKFCEEWQLNFDNLSNIPTKSLLLTRCKCGNQTDDNTLVFYICDHCQHQFVDQELQSRFNLLRQEHYKLMSVTSELTKAVQLNIIGQTNNLTTALEQCKQIYPENESARNKKSPSLTPEMIRCVLETVFDKVFQMENFPGENHVEQIVDESIQSASTYDEFAPTEADNWREINYSKLKHDLVHGENEKKIRILQALRWRITKNDEVKREKIMESFIRNDLLNLYKEKSIPERLLVDSPPDPYVQESICRLINTLASLRQGRDYLTSDEKLLKNVLLKKLKDVKTVSAATVRNMMIGSVQKMSIRKHDRSVMVQEGLFEILIDYMDEFFENLSKYCLECCSALLMNLCLVEEAKQRALDDPKKVIKLLRKFLIDGNDLYLPFVNGMMFSLFEKHQLVKEAKLQSFDKIIINLIKNSQNDTIKKQLDFILQTRLIDHGNSEFGMDDDDSLKEEVDLLETELDQDDFITLLPSGENLLQEYQTDEPKKNHNSLYNFMVDNRKFENPYCYMENCAKLLNGPNEECGCSKCQPGPSKYSCGCYEAIKKDIAEKDVKLVINKSKSMSSKERLKCFMCGEIKCACAFESRPKLHRTP